MPPPSAFLIIAPGARRSGRPPAEKGPALRGSLRDRRPDRAPWPAPGARAGALRLRRKRRPYARPCARALPLGRLPAAAGLRGRCALVGLAGGPGRCRVAPFSVVLGGSRSLSASALPLVSRVVGALAAAGASAWSVGCCLGGDALALSALRSAGCARPCRSSPWAGRVRVARWSGSGPARRSGSCPLRSLRVLGRCGGPVALLRSRCGCAWPGGRPPACAPPAGGWARARPGRRWPCGSSRRPRRSGRSGPLGSLRRWACPCSCSAWASLRPRWRRCARAGRGWPSRPGRWRARCAGWPGEGVPWFARAAILDNWVGQVSEAQLSYPRRAESCEKMLNSTLAQARSGYRISKEIAGTVQFGGLTWS